MSHIIYYTIHIYFIKILMKNRIFSTISLFSVEYKYVILNDHFAFIYIFTYSHKPIKLPLRLISCTEYESLNIRTIHTLSGQTANINTLRPPPDLLVCSFYFIFVCLFSVCFRFVICMG